MTQSVRQVSSSQATSSPSASLASGATVAAQTPPPSSPSSASSAAEALSSSVSSASTVAPPKGLFGRIRHMFSQSKQMMMQYYNGSKLLYKNFNDSTALMIKIKKEGYVINRKEYILVCFLNCNVFAILAL
jgi:hypothetical protein